MHQQPRWVQTIACTKPVFRIKSRWNWEKIWDGTDTGLQVQIWVCRQDLKESFVPEAKLAFGKCLEQVVRLGAMPEVLYPCITVSE